MTIRTKSIFYWIDNVTDENYRLDFNEGVGELTAAVDFGAYSIEQLMNKVASALNDEGDNDYSASFDRTTRLVTISADNNFDLLVNSGTGGVSIFELLGFTGSDRTGDDSYTGNNKIGYYYRPQFFLQDFIDHEDYQESVQAVVNEAASGVIETVSFGSRQFFEMNITLINSNPDISKDSIVEGNSAGVEEARVFLRFCIKKGPLEFMPDRDALASFDTVLLESTPGNKDGVGYKLKELVSRGLAGYFETGRLKFRKV